MCVTNWQWLSISLISSHITSNAASNIALGKCRLASYLASTYLLLNETTTMKVDSSTVCDVICKSMRSWLACRFPYPYHLPLAVSTVYMISSEATIGSSYTVVDWLALEVSNFRGASCTIGAGCTLGLYTFVQTTRALTLVTLGSGTFRCLIPEVTSNFSCLYTWNILVAIYPFSFPWSFWDNFSRSLTTIKSIRNAKRHANGVNACPLMQSSQLQYHADSTN